MNQGTKNGRAKLTEQDVLAIKELLKLGIPQRRIGQMFGVYSSTVSMINTGKLWKHLGVDENDRQEEIKEKKASVSSKPL